MHACAFLGHRNCPESIKQKLLLEIENLIVNEKVDTFYLGTQGGFDKLVYETLCELEKKYEIKTRVALADLNRKKEYIYYDTKKTIFPDCVAKSPPRFAINRRNYYLLQNSDYLICFLNNSLSNTYTFVQTAVKRKIKIINLGAFSIERIQ